MLFGMDPLEIGRLRLSLGYGGHKKGRPYSPIEVAAVLKRARMAGHTMAECADTFKIDKTGLGRFLRLLDLPDDLKHLVDWGKGEGVIGFSSAAQLVRINGEMNQRAVANAILGSRLNSKEVQQIVQLFHRSNRCVGLCIEEVLGMRPTIERRYVFIGSIADNNIIKNLKEFTQRERDQILSSGMDEIGLQRATGRLGSTIFTLSGDELFDVSMNRIGKNNIEEKLRSYISRRIEDAR